MKLKPLFLTCLFACGDDATVQPDAPPTPDPPPTVTIKIATGDAPSLVAIREHDAPEWQIPRSVTASTFEAEIDAPYRVAVICATDSFVFGYQIARTPTENPMINASCAVSSAAAHQVTGSMVQVGTVALGSREDRSTTQNWQFSIPARDGSYDLVAFNRNRIAIKRSVAVAGADLAITPAIDLATQGALLVAAPLTATNPIPDEQLSGNVFLETSSTFANLYDGPAENVKVVPTDLLVTGDVQTATLYSRSGNTMRFTSRNFRAGDSTALALPEPLAGITFGGAGEAGLATWSTLPAFDALTFRTIAFGSSKLWFNTVELSPAYVAATSTLSIGFDTTLPGFLPEWRFIETDVVARTLVLVKELSSIEYVGSSVDDPSLM